MLCRRGAAVLRRKFSATTIKYTKTDEAPMLATYALLPIIKRFTDPAGIGVELTDISVAGRVLSVFGLAPDNLSQLGDLAKQGKANIIKLPNVSASMPQLLDAIAELQAKGYDIPNYPTNPSNDKEREIQSTYSKVIGSAVNPVLREGNSDRRVAPPVKTYAQNHPKRMGKWRTEAKTDVAHMTGGDFFSSEQSTSMTRAASVRIEMVAKDGTTTVLKPEVKLQEGEVIDASVMRVAQLRTFVEETLQECKRTNTMVSLHLKATMMKVSDPIVFGHAVSVFFKDAFEKHASDFAKIGVNPNLGLASVLSTVQNSSLPNKDQILADIDACYQNRPSLAMVDSDRGITNLHVPSDIIIDASMPNVVRDSGSMWNKDNELEETVCIIPDRCYAGVYKAMFDDCKAHGQFDAGTMGNVSNVGLMAQKAEEYGSHDKTFEAASEGTIRVVDDQGNQVFSHDVAKGDIWRMCQTKDAPIKDWVKLAVSRARATGDPTIFWLNPERAHDRVMKEKVEKYLPNHDTNGLHISIMSPPEATKFSCEQIRKGKNAISCTGNVLRDYLTDLFPILELGTSAKMLSIVPMLEGGAMYETGAGGSAPKHVQQFVKEGHLRWDSLGEYLALATSLEDLGQSTNNERATLLGQTLSTATGKLLDENLSPSRKVNERDNRGSTFYIARYWAEAMAKHDDSFKDLADGLRDNEEKIAQELITCQGTPVDLGGYYMVDDVKAEKAMRPSAIFNKLIDGHTKTN